MPPSIQNLTVFCKHKGLKSVKQVVITHYTNGETEAQQRDMMDFDSYSKSSVQAGKNLDLLFASFLF